VTSAAFKNLIPCRFRALFRCIPPLKHIGHEFASGFAGEVAPLDPLLQMIVVAIVASTVAVFVLAAQERSKKLRLGRMLPLPQRPTTLLNLHLALKGRLPSRPQAPDSELPSLIYPASLARFFPLTLPPEKSHAIPGRRSVG
jgi:hypothetical protein